jgi:hypothetical protein
VTGTPAAVWDDLVTAALLGTARRTTDPAGLPGPLAEAAVRLRPDDDAAARLLRVAALATVYRRAGARPRPPRRGPAPVPAEAGRVAGTAAQRRLSRLLELKDAELLALWLRTAVARGLRPHPSLLPALLDIAARSPALRDDVVAAAGERGRWLAAHRPEWSAVVPPGPPARDAWELGSPPERARWLRDVRRTDPAAAREALEASWAREAPAERAGLLELLAAGLSAADEAFLQRCLTDRRGEVREVAARLLTAMPASALARRAAAEALAVVRREGPRLVVAPLPPERLFEAVAAAPLATWVPALGASPADVVGLHADPDPAATLWRGWARAAARERDAAWIAALVARPNHPAPMTAAVTLLLRALDGPWPPAVADAVLRRLPELTTVAGPDVRRLLGLLGHRLPVDATGALRDVGRLWPPEAGMGRHILRAVELMTFRREMLQELE